jgi:hypothetical protein
MQGELENYLGQMIPLIHQSLDDNNNDILTYSLTILQQGFRNCDATKAS